MSLPDAPICSAPPPPGAGLGEGGVGNIHFMMGGTYTFKNGTVNRKPEGMPQTFPRGGFATVYGVNGQIEWTRPDGVHEVVPTKYLYRLGELRPPTY